MPTFESLPFESLSFWVLPLLEAYYMGKRDLLYGQKRPTTWAKETYLEFLSAALASHVAVLSVSNMRQKRPTIWAKETYYMGKRDLLYGQKRPTIWAKETYYMGKRDLLYGQKRTTTGCCPCQSCRRAAWGALVRGRTHLYVAREHISK